MIKKNAITLISGKSAETDLVVKVLEESDLEFDLEAIGSHEVGLTTALAFHIPDIIIFCFLDLDLHADQVIVSVLKSAFKVPLIVITNAKKEKEALALTKKGVTDYLFFDRLDRLPFTIQKELNVYKIQQEKNYLIKQLSQKEQHSNLISGLDTKAYLEVNESRLRAIVQSQTNYLIRVNLEGKYTYCNEKFMVDFAWIYPNSEVVGQDSMVSIIPYHHQRVVEASEKCLANPGTVIQVEIDKPKEAGEVRTTLWDFVCITNQAGEPTEIQCVGIDISDRKKAEQALKESKILHEFVSKATSDVIYDWDLVSGKIYWGEGFNTLFGYELGETTPDISSWSNQVHPDDLNRVTKSLNAAINGTKTKWEDEYKFKKANGQYGYIMEKGFIIRDDKNKAIRMVGAMQDVTEKRRLEELLTKANYLAQIGSYELDLVNNTLFWSEITKEIHEVKKNYKPTLEAALNFYKPGTNRDLITNAVKTCLEHETSFDLELQIITANGNERWIRVIGEVEQEENKSIRLYGSFQNIDSRKKAEIAVLEAYEDRNSILESIDDAFLAVNKAGKVTYWNKKAETIIGRSRQEVLHQDFWEAFVDAIDSPFNTFYYKALTDNKVQRFEAFYNLIGAWLDVNIYPSANGLSIFFKDVTERKMAEIQLLELNEKLKTSTEELLVSNKSMEQFSFIVSHNLRAPVANLLGLAEMLIQDNYPAEIKLDIVKGLLENVKRLDNIIRDLNAILKVKKELMELKQEVNLPELIQSIEDSIGNLVVKEQVLIKSDFSAVNNLYTIKSYLHSVFYNLITNSIKYRQPQSTPFIQIKSEILNGKLFIHFQDNGLGIDLERKKDQVFGLYKRFHKHVEGKGLGLYMVKTQVEALGGKVSIESEVNKGTKFTIEFKYQDVMVK
ncbi:PAS domain-containing sensor histidine kinase [Adhaeribacter aquaticus]|uniref:PAS domain-containing sensor histidine kinase n=1 Tax=Adhaeribacter aquaticus TaxID=299567 RepID=UPI0004215FCA|nr:PAS domain-containing protein [Adhaeribacter aquaticus]